MTFSDFAQKGCLSTSPPPRLPPWPLATVLSSQRPSPFCHPERSRGTCGAPEPKTKAPTSEFADLARTLCSSRTSPFTRDDKPLDVRPLVPTPGVANCGQPRSQATTVWATPANSLVGAFVLGSGAPQVPRLRLSASSIYRVTHRISKRVTFGLVLPGKKSISPLTLNLKKLYLLEQKISAGDGFSRDRARPGSCR